VLVVENVTDALKGLVFIISCHYMMKCDY
jgi:hypothetical protein